MNAPIKEGREILARVMSALVDAPECYIPVRGPWLPLTEAQTANWDARQTVSKLLRDGDANLETNPFGTGICMSVIISEDAASEQEKILAQTGGNVKLVEQDMEETEERARVEAKAAQTNLFS